MAGHGADATGSPVAAAAGELYGLPLAEFTAARAERAKQARADGDRAAAAAIGRLAKPSVVAWLANQLARQYPGELAPLLELGDALRRATAALDAAQLRQLSRQQQQVVSALMGRVRELAAAAGQAVSDSTARGVEDTLHAALADESAARELTGGQLAAGLSRTGFPGIDSAAGPAPAGPRAAAGQRRQPAGPARPGQRGAKAEPGRPAQAAAEARRQQLERARRAEADAQGYAGEAGRDQDRARSALTAAQHAVRSAEETISRLQDELDTALDARNNAGRAERQAAKEADRADRTARQAGRRLAEATARRQELEGGA
jgi:hypothetical protein